MKRVVLDLTRPLDATTPIYGTAGYSDPPLAVTPWCGIADQGFRCLLYTSPSPRDS